MIYCWGTKEFNVVTFAGISISSIQLCRFIKSIDSLLDLYPSEFENNSRVWGVAWLPILKFLNREQGSEKVTTYTSVTQCRRLSIIQWIAQCITERFCSITVLSVTKEISPFTSNLKRSKPNTHLQEKKIILCSWS